MAQREMTTKEIVCNLLDISHEEYDNLVKMFGCEADPMMLLDIEPCNNVEGLQKLLDNSNPYYGGL